MVMISVSVRRGTVSSHMAVIVRYDVFPATVVRHDTRVTVIACAAGQEFRALLRNTGRLADLIHPGAEILCLPKEGGKTAAQVLGTVVDDERATLLDTLVQARAFETAAKRGLIPWLPGIVRREVRVRESRLDYAIEGYPCLIAFIAAHPAADRFCPDVETDPEIGKALLAARAAGVGIHALKLHLTRAGAVVLDSPAIPVVLQTISNR